MMYPYFHEDLAPFTREDKLCHFAPVPIGVLEMGLRPSAVLVYIKLLNRATLSQKNGWWDHQGWVYVNYSVPHLALELKMGESTIRELLRVLENRELIFRTYPMAGEVSEIYLRVPKTSLDGQKFLPDPAGNPDPLENRALPMDFWRAPSGNLEAI